MRFLIPLVSPKGLALIMAPAVPDAAAKGAQKIVR
jgi:hypothetical protein